MRTRQRLEGLKAWIYTNLCEGRLMKTKARGSDIGTITRQEPTCFVGWAPTRADSTGWITTDIESVSPCICLMPNHSYVKHTEEKRFDRYNNVHRPPMMGSRLSVSILFSVYEPGVRLEGFVDSVGQSGEGLDTSLIVEGTEQGLYTLLDWMDDCKEGLLRDKIIPGTDLAVDEDSITYSLYTDQEYIVDRRPLYYGFINATFYGYADSGHNQLVNDYLQ